MSTEPLHPHGTPRAWLEVRGLQRQADIGCSVAEHGVLQPVLLDLRAGLMPSVLLRGDATTPALDYLVLVQAVDAALASRDHVALQETLCVAIAARVLADPRIDVIELRLAKTAAYPGCEGLGIHTTIDRATLRQVAHHYLEDPAVRAWSDAPGP